MLAGRIVEIEAYLGPHNEPPDPAAHMLSRADAAEHRSLWSAGHAYVYAIYGRYFCMNITCEAEGRAGCVLLRALEPWWRCGPDGANRGLAAGAAARQLTGGPSRLVSGAGADAGGAQRAGFAR